MADDTEEYMQMNKAYKGRIVDTLRNPLKSDKDSVTVVKKSPAPPPSASPGEPTAPKKKQAYPGDSIKSSLADAFDKWGGLE